MQSTQTLPNQQGLARLTTTLQAHMARYGYQVVETPVIQAADLFLTRAGDQIVNRLFTFERYGRLLALRPEFTATAAYNYARQHPNGGATVRWQFDGAIFEDDPDRIDHSYQFLSIGAELIGLAGPLADSEIIGMAVNGIASQHIPDWRVVSGHAGLLRLLLARYRLDGRTEQFLLGHLGLLKTDGREAVLARLEKLLPEASPRENNGTADADSYTELNTQQMLDVFLDATQRSTTMGGRSRHDIVRRLLQKRQRASERPQILGALDFLEHWAQIDAPPDQAFPQIAALIGPDLPAAQRVLAEWQDTVEMLAAYGVSAEQITLQPALARSWDYYTGIVFELYGGPDVHLGGGGRYDELIQLVGGNRAVPAVGFVYYPDRINAIRPTTVTPGERTVTLLIDSDALPSGIEWAQTLRAHDIQVTVQPSDTPINNDITTLRVAADSTIQHHDTRYPLVDIDRLLSDLFPAEISDEATS